jgi:hypothetical protein
LKTAIVAGAAVVAVAIVVAVFAGGGFSAIKRDLASHTAATAGGDAPSSVAEQIVYTARTANVAAIILPAKVQQQLQQAGHDHQTVELDQVGYTGEVTSSYVDMTPRTGPSSTDPPLRVNGRIGPAIDAKISAIQSDVDSPLTSTSGGQALFAGLTKITFSAVPVTIISSGLDLANPDNFRKLDWSVPAAVVVADVRDAGELPALHGPVTFTLVPTTGAQQQLDQAQKNYVQAIWTALLKAAGATSVTFTYATPATAGSAAPSAPAVTIPPLTITPIPQVPVGNNKVTCTVPDSYFVFGESGLINSAETAQSLAPCVDAALAAHATFALDGFASYEGPLTADGKPELNYPANQRLSVERVQTITGLLLHQLHVPPDSITHEAGHGNVDQPDASDPRSAANRVVVITYTVN